MADERLFRPAIEGLVPYEPGKPVEEVQRELGLARVVKLASNEGQFGPFPAALAAIARGAPELNRYPDGGAYRLRTALAEKRAAHGPSLRRRANPRRDHRANEDRLPLQSEQPHRDDDRALGNRFVLR